MSSNSPRASENKTHINAVRSPFKWGVYFAWVNPWLAMPFAFCGSDYNIKLRVELLFSIILITWGFLTVFMTYNVNILPNIILMSAWMLLFNRKARISINFLPVLIYIGVGLLVSLLFYNGNQGRVGLFGGEPNFGGFLILLMFAISLHVGRYRFISLAILFAGILITGSRALALVSILTLLLWVLRGHRKLSVALVSLFVLMYAFAGHVLDYYVGMQIFSQSGYSAGIDRLANFNDSSTMERLLLNELWIDAIDSNAKNVIFGLSFSEHQRLLESSIGLNPHNSFIQKTAEFGLVYTIFLLIFAYKFLPLSFFLVFVVYSMFLHNILSVPWIIAVSIYIGIYNDR